MTTFTLLLLELDGVHGVSAAAGVGRRVVEQHGTQRQDADRAQRRRDQDGEHGQGQHLGPHPLPLSLAVLYAVVQEHGPQRG